MSENRDIEGTESLKDPSNAEVQQEEEAMEKTDRGNTSLTDIASDDETHSEAISKLGEPSNREGQEELLVSATNPTRVGRNMGFFLFEVYLTPRDITRNRLFIPVEQALDHFPPLANRQETYVETIVLYVPMFTTMECDIRMFATIEYDIQECVFVENELWRHLVGWHNLKAWDVIRFYRPPRQPIQENYYLVDFLKRDEEIAGIPEFKPQNFLFQLMVTGVMYNRLLVPKEAVRSHFSALGIPAKTHGIERLYFSDAANSNWSIEVMSYGNRDPQYMLVMEDDFVNHYNLEDGHVIRFYKPDDPWSSRHFLIAFGDDGGRRSHSSGQNDWSTTVVLLYFAICIIITQRNETV